MFPQEFSNQENAQSYSTEGRRWNHRSIQSRSKFYGPRTARNSKDRYNHSLNMSLNQSLNSPGPSPTHKDYSDVDTRKSFRSGHMGKYNVFLAKNKASEKLKKPWLLPGNKINYSIFNFKGSFHGVSKPSNNKDIFHSRMTTGCNAAKYFGVKSKSNTNNHILLN
jgi:hypothetical protein